MFKINPNTFVESHVDRWFSNPDSFPTFRLRTLGRWLVFCWISHSHSDRYRRVIVLQFNVWFSAKKLSRLITALITVFMGWCIHFCWTSFVNFYNPKNQSGITDLCGYDYPNPPGCKSGLNRSRVGRQSTCTVRIPCRSLVFESVRDFSPLAKSRLSRSVQYQG